MSGRIRARSNRGSSRSRGSSNYSYEKEPKEKVKDCCRKFIAFMCTQVGVGGLVVSYALIGAISFMKIEGRPTNSSEVEMVQKLRNECLDKLWNITDVYNILNQSKFYEEYHTELKNYQDQLVKIFYHGYDLNPEEMWSFSAALMFSLSIITMIGYGNMVPKTMWGKIATVIYAMFGIPLYILFFLNMGGVLAGCFKWFYRWLYQCSTEQDPDQPPKKIIVPSTACLWVIGAYILGGSIMFASWEKWSFLDSTYFCVTSLCKLGLGDLVPGFSGDDTKVINQTKMVITFLYMLGGIGLVAMCYNLMREDIRVKVQEMREDFSQCLEDTRVKLIKCYRRGRKIDEEYAMY